MQLLSMLACIFGFSFLCLSRLLLLAVQLVLPLDMQECKGDANNNDHNRTKHLLSFAVSRSWSTGWPGIVHGSSATPYDAMAFAAASAMLTTS